MATLEAALETLISALTADASPDGAADYVLTLDDSAAALKKVLLNNLPGGGGVTDTAGAYIEIREEQTNGTNAGSASTGWQTRVLNTEHADPGGHASVASNQVTLAAGTYRAWASAPAIQVNRHKLRLRNITDTATLLAGINAFSHATDASVITPAILTGRFTIAAPKVVELQHYCETAKATTGLGAACSASETEVYAVLVLVKEP